METRSSGHEHNGSRLYVRVPVCKQLRQGRQSEIFQARCQFLGRSWHLWLLAPTSASQRKRRPVAFFGLRTAQSRSHVLLHQLQGTLSRCMSAQSHSKRPSGGLALFALPIVAEDTRHEGVKDFLLCRLARGLRHVQEYLAERLGHGEPDGGVSICSHVGCQLVDQRLCAGGEPDEYAEGVGRLCPDSLCGIRQTFHVHGLQLGKEGLQGSAASDEQGLQGVDDRLFDRAREAVAHNTD
mmetsp:Transcript_16211/g.41214  ORF Transcript_16211/g.41214 Transcript_16211/m.41214 type:complete len:239 (-) Transcript_16211:764-1480(-)